MRLDDRDNEVLRFITENRVRHVVVMRGDKIGIVSVGDAVKASKDAELENKVLLDKALAKLATA